MAYPTASPTMAIALSSTIRMVTSKNPFAATSPARNSRESPGRKKTDKQAGFRKDDGRQHQVATRPDQVGQLFRVIETFEKLEYRFQGTSGA